MTNLAKAEDWYRALAVMDGFLLTVWLLAALLVPSLLLFKFLAEKLLLRFHIKPFNFKPFDAELFKLPMPYFWLLLIGLALLLRLPRLLFEPFWYDETFTAAIANTSFDKFWIALSGDVHPPLFYLIAWAISHFSRAEWALRLPSLVAGLVLIYVVYLLALELFNDKSLAKIAAVLIALLPAMIHYSAEARYPMLLALCISTAWLALLRDKLWLFTLAAIATAWLHAIGIIYAFVLALVAFFLIKNWLRWLWPAMAISMAIGAWLSFLLQQTTDVANGFWLWRMFPLWHIVDGTILKPIAGGNGIFLLPICLLIVLFSIFGAWLMLRSGSKTFVFMLSIGIAVPLGLFLIGLVWNPVYLPRALLASVVPVLIGIAVIARRNPLFAFTLFLTIAVSMLIYFVPDEKIDTRDIFQHCEGSDYTYTSSTNTTIVALYYAPSPVLAYIEGNNMNQELPLSSREALGFDFRPPELFAANVCLFVSWNFYMSQAEQERIASLRQYQVSSEILQDSPLTVYEVIWLRIP